MKAGLSELFRQMTPSVFVCEAFLLPGFSRSQCRVDHGLDLARAGLYGFLGDGPVGSGSLGLV